MCAGPAIHSYKLHYYHSIRMLRVRCIGNEARARARGLSNNVERDFRLELYAIKCSEGLMLCARLTGGALVYPAGKIPRILLARAFSNNKVRKLRVADDSPWTQNRVWMRAWTEFLSPTSSRRSEIGRSRVAVKRSICGGASLSAI